MKSQKERKKTTNLASGRRGGILHVFGFLKIEENLRWSAVDFTAGLGKASARTIGMLLPQTSRVINDTLVMICGDHRPFLNLWIGGSNAFFDGTLLLLQQCESWQERAIEFRELI
jgi:hypothetical protein